MGAFTIGGILCILGLCQWTLKSLLRTGSKRYSDGPRPLGIFGNVVLLRRLQFYPDQVLINIARIWGDTCLLWAARYPMLIVNKPQVAKELLVDVTCCPTTSYPCQSTKCLQRGIIYSSRPEPNKFRTSIWPWRLPLIPGGETFRYLRKLYHNLLSPQRSTELRKYQDFESLVLLSDLLTQPEEFFGDIERYSLSVIFSAVYGIRLGKLDHPIMIELFQLWLLMLQRKDPHYPSPQTRF